MKHNLHLWLAASLVPLLLGLSSAVGAQTLAGSLSSTGTQTLQAGSSFSDGGTVTVTASGVSGTLTFSSVTVSVSNPNVFSSLTLNASSPNGSESDDVPLASGDNTITLSQITLSNGQTATFTLTGVVTTTPSSINLVRRQLHRFESASMLSSGPGGAFTMLLMGLIAFVLLAANGRLRRKHLIGLAVWLVMAAVVAGCGNGGTGSSDQQFATISATSSSGATINVTGLPIDMGTISVQSSGSSQTTGGPTAQPT
jgi:hypothetical protein